MSAGLGEGGTGTLRDRIYDVLADDPQLKGFVPVMESNGFAIYLRAGDSFFANSVGGDMLSKITSAQESHGAPPGVYFLLLWVTFWPGAPLAAIALSTDSSALTCIANDYAFDEVFARQVAGLGRAGDLLIGISTSGNSRNVIRAVEEAQRLGMATLGLLGRDGGQLRRLCQHSIIVPSQVTARIQECHILIGHTLCGLIEQELGLA